MREFKFLRKNNPTHSVQLSPECYLPGYYDTTNRVFKSVSPEYFEPFSFNQFKYMIYRHRYNDEEISRHKIGPDHPMYNFNGTR